MLSLLAISLTYIRDIIITSRWSWRRPFWGHSIIMPTLDSHPVCVKERYLVIVQMRFMMRVVLAASSARSRSCCRRRSVWRRTWRNRISTCGKRCGACRKRACCRWCQCAVWNCPWHNWSLHFCSGNFSDYLHLILKWIKIFVFTNPIVTRP